MAKMKKNWLRKHARNCLPLVASITGLVVVSTVWLAAPPSALMVTIGLMVSLLLGLTLASLLRTQRPTFSALETPFLLAHDAAVFPRYRELSQALLAISQWGDPIYRDLALDHLDALVARTKDLGDGTFDFEGTETWRIVYEGLLRSPGLHLYRSVAWIKHRHYWQDEPGRKSLAVNFELHDAERLNIERIAIIADELWPKANVWPVEGVRQWLHEQHNHGIWIKFVRESALKNERELIADIGIYGSRALGIQELDEECRTVRFTLSFDFHKVAAAEGRWDRLSVYAEAFGAYLDRYELME